MSSSKTNIQSTNKPPKFKPHATTITKAHKPKKEAKHKPREKHNKCSLQEHSL